MTREVLWIKCDRCGSAVLLHHKSGALIDNSGYSDPPEGWVHGESQDLCPKCSAPKRACQKYVKK